MSLASKNERSRWRLTRARENIAFKSSGQLEIGHACRRSRPLHRMVDLACDETAVLTQENHDHWDDSRLISNVKEMYTVASLFSRLAKKARILGMRLLLSVKKTKMSVRIMANGQTRRLFTRHPTLLKKNRRGTLPFILLRKVRGNWVERVTAVLLVRLPPSNQ